MGNCGGNLEAVEQDMLAIRTSMETLNQLPQRVQEVEGKVKQVQDQINGISASIEKARTAIASLTK